MHRRSTIARSGLFAHRTSSAVQAEAPGRARALTAIADLVAPGGDVLVSCRSRNAGAQPDTFPLALDREEIDGFQRAGLTETHFVAYDDDQDPPVPHFFAVYRRPV